VSSFVFTHGTYDSVEYLYESYFVKSKTSLQFVSSDLSPQHPICNNPSVHSECGGWGETLHCSRRASYASVLWTIVKRYFRHRNVFGIFVFDSVVGAAALFGLPAEILHDNIEHERRVEIQACKFLPWFVFSLVRGGITVSYVLCEILVSEQAGGNEKAQSSTAKCAQFALG